MTNNASPQPIKFLRYACTVQFARYQADNTLCIRLIEVESGDPIATPTVCVAGRADLGKDELLIKSYDYPRAVEQLLEQGVLKSVTGYFDTLGGNVRKIKNPEQAVALLTRCRLSESYLAVAATQASTVQA